MKWIILFVVFFGFSGSAVSQGLDEPLELRAGLTWRLGTERAKLGCILGASYKQEHWQLNALWGWDWSWKDLGPKIAHGEYRLGLGASGALGGDEEWFPEDIQGGNSFLSPVRNSSGKAYTAGFGFWWYFNKIGTDQMTGVLEFEIDRWVISHENDVFIGKASDKFRTASVFIGYRFDEARLGWSTIMWHADTRGEGRNWVYESNSYKSRHGYIDLSKVRYGNLSHGIMAFEFMQELPWGQAAGISLGVDSDKVRHLFQNKIMHDMPWWPRSWKQPKNPHIPMIDEEGKAYLFREGQEVRADRFYIEAFMNSVGAY